MKSFNSNYAQSIINIDCEPRAYVKIETNDSYDIYLTTHTGIIVVSAPDQLVDDVISELSTSSESITPEKGISVLGGGSISLNEALFTDELRTLLTNNKTIFNNKVEIYSGTADIDITDYEKVQTLYVKDVSSSDVSYTISLSTAQIFTSKKLFEKKATELFASFASNEVLTEIEVLSTTGFELVAHDDQWENSPSEEVGYLTFGGQDAEGNPVTEVIKWWSKDATKFYGDPMNGGILERSVFNTGLVTATGTSDSDTATQVEEYIYIDLATGKMLIALLTGDLYGQVGKTLPDNWHAGIDSAFINVTSLENIGFDLWNPADDTGFHFYIDNPNEDTAKQYIAREILRVSSLAFLTDVNGEIAAKRYSQIINGASTAAILTDNDISNKPNFNRNSGDVRNEFAVRWDYRANLERYIRNEIIIDADSQERNGIISRAETILLKAVRNNQIEVNELLKTVTDGIRTRLVNPSIKPSITTSFRRTVSLEVLDVIGLDLVGFSDYSDIGDINRPFEIQSIQHDWINRTVSIKLYGSSDPASPLETAVGSGIPVIDHTGYLPFEDSLVGTFTDTGTTLTLTSDCSLSSIADIGLSVKYYYDGLINLNGFQLQIFGSVFIDATDFNALNSTINGVGNGTSGGLGQDTSVIAANDILGGGGYFGNYDTAEESIVISGNLSSVNQIVRVPRSLEYSNNNGRSSIDNFVLYVDENGKLNGLPDSLAGNAGSGGLWGYGVFNTPNESFGGDGANGGAGLFIIANTFISNANTSIDLSGNSITDLPIPVPTSVNTNLAGGRGGVGWGGILGVFIKDRSSQLASNIDNIFESKCGENVEWLGFGAILRPNETSQKIVATNAPTVLQAPFYYEESLADIAGIDFSGNAFISKYIGAAVQNIPQVGRDPIGLVPAPLTLDLTESINTPSTPLGNISTVTTNVTPPADTNYSYTNFSFRLITQDAYYPLTYKIPDESSFEVESNGSTYEVKAQSVSKQGVLGGAITETITVKNVLTEPAIEPNVIVPRLTGLQLKNRIAINVFDKYKSGNAEFVWNSVSNNHAVGFGNEGLLGADSGSFDPYFKDYKVDIYDTNRNLLRTEFTKTESYTYTLEKNKKDGAGREFIIQVRVRGQNNQIGEGVQFQAENPEPDAPTGLNAKPSYNSIQVEYVAPENDIDFIGVNMRVREIAGVWSVAVFFATTACNVADLNTSTEYEIELTSVDEFGAGASTSVISTTSKIESASLDDITTPIVIDENGGLLITNNTGFTSVTGVSDGSWNQLPNPTIYTAIDTNTDTQVFGVDVLGNTIIGNGDSSVLFNQFTNAIEFGDDVTIGSNVDQTVTVGTGGDYATINEALEQLSKIVPAYKSGGFTAEISILSGETINEQIRVDGIDLSFITISSIDSIVDVSGVGFVSIGGRFPFINITSGAVSPNIDTVFESLDNAAFMVGLYANGGNSHANVMNSAGFTHFSQNLVIEAGASFFGNNGVYTDATSASVLLVSGASAILDDSNFNDSGTAASVRDSTISMQRSTLLNCEVAIYMSNGIVQANSIDARFAEKVLESFGGTINLELADLSEFTTSGGSSVIELHKATKMNAISANLSHSSSAVSATISIRATDSDVNVNSVNFTLGPSTSSSIVLTATDMKINNSADFGIIASRGSIVGAAQSVNYTSNLIGQTVTVNGILFE